MQVHCYQETGRRVHNRVGNALVFTTSGSRMVNAQAGMQQGLTSDATELLAGVCRPVCLRREGQARLSDETMQAHTVSAVRRFAELLLILHRAALAISPFLLRSFQISRSNRPRQCSCDLDVRVSET